MRVGGFAGGARGFSSVRANISLTPHLPFGSAFIPARAEAADSIAGRPFRKHNCAAALTAPLPS